MRKIFTLTSQKARRSGWNTDVAVDVRLFYAAVSYRKLKLRLGEALPLGKCGGAGVLVI